MARQRFLYKVQKSRKLLKKAPSIARTVIPDRLFGEKQMVAYGILRGHLFYFRKKIWPNSADAKKAEETKKRFTRSFMTLRVQSQIYFSLFMPFELQKTEKAHSKTKVC